MSMDKLYIVGVGVGDETLLTEKAVGVITGVDRVLSTGGRQCPAKAKSCTLAELDKALENKTGGSTAVLVGGDCGFFSVSRGIIEKFSGLYDIELVNGISSVQYFSARIAVPYDDALICSMHGRNERLVPKVAYNRKVFVLTGGEYKAHNICEMLFRAGLSALRVRVGERLSYPDERIIEGTAGELKDLTFDGLSVMYIENESFVSPHSPLRDVDFIRGGAPMTKEEVRWLSLQKLGIQPADVVYDIGAGTGAVSVEMARKAFDGLAYAVEMNADACDLITQNKLKHGAYNLDIVHAKAPEGLDALPKPDKAFIGGSSGEISGILSMLIKKNPAVKVVSTAVSLQGLSRILEGYEKVGADTDVICVNIAKAKRVKGYDIMTAQNPVYIVTGVI